ncbi:MAG: glycosyltransferase [Bacteroidota bacterium]
MNFSLFAAWQIFVTVWLFIFLIFSLYNSRRFSKVFKKSFSGNRDSAPKISVLIPARNEEFPIRRLVESLLKQDYPNYEIIVLNDNSTDKTGEILDKLLKTSNGLLKVINGSELPPGWVGKNWACHQLFKAASGELLLFTDADTWYEREALSSSVNFLKENSVDFFSVIPFHEMKTWGENVALPFLHFQFVAYLPNELMMKSQNIKFSAANGQFMFFKRSVYQAIGGHETVKNNIVEDIFLARLLKTRGYKIALANAIDIVGCRMYRSFDEVFKGFSKNFFAAMKYNIFLMAAFLLHLVALYIAPLFFLIIALFKNDFSITSFWLPLAHLIMAGIIRYLVSVQFRMPRWQALLQPASAFMTMLIGINSVRWAFSKRGSEWKGRTYLKSETIPDNF